MLGRLLVRIGPLRAHFAAVGSFFADFERAASLPVRYGQAERAGAFARAGVTLGHFPQALPRHLERAVRRARPVPAYLSRPPTLGMP